MTDTDLDALERRLRYDGPLDIRAADAIRDLRADVYRLTMERDGARQDIGTVVAEGREACAALRADLTDARELVRELQSAIAAVMAERDVAVRDKDILCAQLAQFMADEFLSTLPDKR